MKKIIPFTKDIKFNTKIYEINSISLENTLVVDENNEIEGEFIISGEYKMNDSSINNEPFIYGLPFNITLDDNLQTDTIKIDIDDFKYEIINEEILRVNIDVSVDGKIKIIEEKEEVEEESENIIPDIIIEARKNKDDEFDIKEYNDIKNDKMEVNEMNNEEIDLFKEESNIEKVFDSNTDKKVTSIFENFDSKDEKYVSYYVHIVRENDNIDSICTKYNITKDDLKEYNNVEQITLGNKLIIPYINNETV